jgi:hypothetical protein
MSKALHRGDPGTDSSSHARALCCDDHRRPGVLDETFLDGLYPPFWVHGKQTNEKGVFDRLFSQGSG